MLQVSGGAQIRTQASQESMLLVTILCCLHKGDSQINDGCWFTNYPKDPPLFPFLNVIILKQ